MSLRRFGYLILILFVAAVSGLAGAAGGGWLVYQASLESFAAAVEDAVPTSPAVTTVSNSENEAAQELFVSSTDVETAITETVQQVGPAVVTVFGTIPGQLTPFGRTSGGEVSGSGVFISEDGYVLTNNHVIEDTSELWVILSDGTEQAATLVGTDIYADLAVLKTEGTVPGVAALGNSDSLDAGETVIAIGSPLGEFTNSVTVGVVSSTGRSIDTGQGYQIEDLIQTDAAINSGNSGGPLVSLAGEVIGINTLVVRNSGSGTTAEGLGFAIPANTAQAIASQIIENGRVSRPYMGIEWQAVTPNIARMYRLPVEYGAYVIDVVSGSPADEAGIRAGDIITKLDDIELDDSQPYINTLFQFKPGDEITITLSRSGQTMEFQIVLGGE